MLIICLLRTPCQLPHIMIYSYTSTDVLNILQSFGSSPYLCVQLPSARYSAKRSSLPFVEDATMWLLQVVIEYVVCSVCDHMELPQETLVYIEPVPLGNECHSYFSWEGDY